MIQIKSARQLTTYPWKAGFQADNFSKQAASQINPKLKELQQRVLDCVKEQDATADKIAELLSLPVETVKPRLTELKLMGLIKKSGKRGVTALGGSCNIWTTGA